MKAEEIRKTLGPWLSRVRRPGWKPVVVECDAAPTASKFCGVPWTGPGATWPNCGKCREPLTLLLQLALDELPEELGSRFGSGLLQLFYCLQDDCQGVGGWEPFADDLSRVRIVHPTPPIPPPLVSPGQPHLPPKRIMGWTRLEDLPSPAEHEECNLKYTYDFQEGTLRLECPELGFDCKQRMRDCEAEEIAIAEPGDKLGGWPAWVQGVEYPNCPTCGLRMVLLFQIDSEDNIPVILGDLGCGHITQCPVHKEVVAFGWACC